MSDPTKNRSRRMESARAVDEPMTATPGRIFISYRRQETAYPAGWLFDRLVDHYGAGQVFKDIDSIEPGDDFVDVIATAVASCDVLLALIGSHWLDARDDAGNRRIDNPADFVRLEIEAAISRRVRLVPVLVDDGKMPRPEDLPESLAPLARRQALELRPSHFDFETSRLVRVIDETLAERRAAARTTEDRVPVASELIKRRAAPSRRRRLSPRVALLGAAPVVVLATFIAVLLKTGGPSPVSPPKATSAIFKDDFSTRAYGWDDSGRHRNGGHYVNGAYRLHTRWTSDHYSDTGLPHNATTVFPAAPRDVSVEVVARRLLGADEDAGYGIICRSASTIASYYEFAIWRDHVAIAKLTPTPPYYAELTSADLSAVNVNGDNRLQASCTTDTSGATALRFTVNRQVVARATDRHNPHSSGSVGLVVATGDRAKAIEASFDDFVVRAAAQ
jgi:TIR domain